MKKKALKILSIQQLAPEFQPDTSICKGHLARLHEPRLVLADIGLLEYITNQMCGSLAVITNTVQNKASD